MHDLSYAEQGMLRAIAGAAVLEACRTGCSHSEFHHFSVDARCNATHREPQGRAAVELVVRFHGEVLEREFIEVGKEGESCRLCNSSV